MENQDYRNRICSYLNNRGKQYADYLEEKYKKFKYICVFGVGNIGKSLPEELAQNGIVVNFFCDNDNSKVGNKYNGILCISLEELETYKDETVVIIATRYFKEIYKQLQELGFKNLDRVLSNKFDVDGYFRNNKVESVIDKITKVIDILADEESKRVYTRIIEEWCINDYSYGQLDDICLENQYFDKDVIKLEKDEIFVDCGAYIGDTLDDFILVTGGKFQKAYLFELSILNFKILENRVKDVYAAVSERIESINSGVADVTKEIYYCEDDEGSLLSEGGNQKGHVIKLDDYFTNKKVSYIKMDIEGAELSALNGAEKLLKRCSPKLAVCLYHKPQDLWEIPLYLKKLVPEYKLFIRHYTDLLNETVCYALI